MRKLFFGLLSVLLLAACGDDEPEQRSKNYIRLTTSSATELNEDSNDTIKVDVTLGYTLEEPATINFVLEGNEGDILAIDQPSIALLAGDKVKTINVYSNKKSALSENRTITLKVKDFTDPNMEAWGEGIVINVKPDSDIPELTDAQKELLQGYKNNLNMDISRVLGKLSCDVKVTFPQAEVGETEGEPVFTESEIKEFKTETIVSLSEKATAEQPILTMLDNPMGISSLFRSVLEQEIAIQNKVGTAFPSVAEAINFDKKNETFSMSLDSIVVKDDAKVSFIVETLGNYEDSLSYIPFAYQYSAWDRQLKMKEEGKTIDLVTLDPETGQELDRQEETPMETCIEYGLHFDPAQYLFLTSIHSDDWGEKLWKPATSKIDFEKGTWTVTFPWDHMNSSDWTIIEVTYHLHSVK